MKGIITAHGIPLDDDSDFISLKVQQMSDDSPEIEMMATSLAKAP